MCVCTFLHYQIIKTYNLGTSSLFMIMLYYISWVGVNGCVLNCTKTIKYFIFLLFDMQSILSADFEYMNKKTCKLVTAVNEPELNWEGSENKLTI